MANTLTAVERDPVTKQLVEVTYTETARKGLDELVTLVQATVGTALQSHLSSDTIRTAVGTETLAKILMGSQSIAMAVVADLRNRGFVTETAPTKPA